MRYEKDERLLKLVFFLQTDSAGRTLSDVMDEFEVSRRTAERMRDAVERVFPQLEEVGSDDRQKRWRVPSQTTNGWISFSSSELSTLEFCAQLLERENMLEHAHNIDAVINKIKSSLRQTDKLKLAPDIEALTEAEGLAMRPGPKLKQNLQHMQDIRTAILMQRKIDILVEFRGSGKKGRQTVEPYGFLYGTRNYLIGKMSSKQAVRMFSLSNIDEVTISSESFVKDESFSLKKYAEQSFGVFQEEPVEVCWRFSPKVAKDAKDYQFHPEQTTEELEDGSLVVRFRAGGRKEMDWHLYTWGDEVKVLS